MALYKKKTFNNSKVDTADQPIIFLKGIFMSNSALYSIICFYVRVVAETDLQILKYLYWILMCAPVNLSNIQV